MNEPRSGGLGVAQILRIVIFLSLLIVAGWLLYTIRSTLAPFVIAFVLSYLLMPLVDMLESHRVNRLGAVVGVLMTVFAIVVIPLIYVAPIIVQGAEDMMSRITGDEGTWFCVVENSDDAVVTIDRFESILEDFEVEGLPITLAPGNRDTLVVVFSPQVYETRQSDLDLFGFVEDVETGPIRMVLTGNWPNLSSVSDTTIHEPTEQVVFGQSKILISATQHTFGIYRPGYLALVKSYNQNLQVRLEESWPMLKGQKVMEAINARLQNMATDLLKKTPGLIGQVLSGLTFVIIVPLVLFFFLAEGRTIKRAMIELVPNQYFEMVLNLLYRIDVQLGGYIRGMVLSVMIISLLSVTGLYFIELEYFLVIGTLAGLANVIPYLGPLIGIVAGVIAAALQYSTLSVGVVVPVVIVFLIVQVMDNVFVAPVVVARSVNLHPLVVIFVVLVGSQLFGAVGMLLAVPATAVIKVSAQTIYEGLRSYSV
ncbi:MAG: AI-2E family transporter [Candidatus Latescibacteria bacterium]|nr:AI-2E family transporter [Candidatus Latescibacterota bacterium]